MMQNLTDNWQHRSQPRTNLAQHELECKLIFIFVIIVVVVVVVVVVVILIILIVVIIVVIITGASRP